MNSRRVLCKRHDSSVAKAQISVYLAALENFAQLLPSRAKLVRWLASERNLWKSEIRQPALARIARSAELAEGSNHFLETGYAWFSPNEPQATAALVALLVAGDRATRLARGQALWDAAMRARCLEGNLPLLGLNQGRLERPPSITAEFGTDDSRRIDILLKGLIGGEPVELVIEAKLGHHLTPEQLSAYTKEYRGVVAERQLLLVLCPKLIVHDATLILKENRRLGFKKQWRFATWRNFLIDYSCALPPEHDDNEFRRLRRSLADHAASWE